MAASKSQNGTVTALHKQYGGIHIGKWVDRLPTAWVPFIQLARLSPPTPVFLAYFPHVYGIIYGAIVRQSPVTDLIWMLAWFLGASLFVSNAAHGWDDLADAPIDKLIPRTQKRPIVRGAITPLAAFIFTAVNALIAAAFLIVLPRATSLYVCPTIIATTYYPYAKRHINCPQMVLGFCLAWGIAVGASAMGADPLADNAVPFLVVGCAMWSVIFDTIYASIDVQYDIRLGLGSTAVLFGSQVKPCLMGLLAILLGSLAATGVISGFGILYHIIALGGCAISLGSMIINVKLSDSFSCWWWFTYGFWGAGFAIAVSLLSQYLL